MDTLQSWHFSGWPFLYGCHVLAAAFYSLLMLMTTKMVRWYICLYLEPSKSAHKYNHFHNLMVTLVVQIAVPCADSECEQLEIYIYSNRLNLQLLVIEYGMHILLYFLCTYIFQHSWSWILYLWELVLLFGIELCAVHWRDNSTSGIGQWKWIILPKRLVCIDTILWQVSLPGMTPPLPNVLLVFTWYPFPFFTALLLLFIIVNAILGLAWECS